MTPGYGLWIKGYRKGICLMSEPKYLIILVTVLRTPFIILLLML